MAARFKKLTIDTSSTSKYQITQYGTYTEEDVRINKSGVKICGTPALSRSITVSEDNSSDVVSNYTIDQFDELVDTGEELGRGRSATVRKAIHQKSGTLLALKVVAVETSDESRKVILQELRVLYECNHPNIVSFYGAFYESLSVYIALEYMECGSLADVISNYGPIPEPYLREIGIRALDGLTYIHKTLHTVHRDLKPGNMLLNKKGEVKIADFGVSGKLAHTAAVKDTFVGTVTYMSPERIAGQSHTANSDIWSFGLTILELATGKYPYLKESQDQPLIFFDLLCLIQKEPAPTLPADHFSPSLISFCNRCLEKDPNLRPSSSEVAELEWLQVCPNTPVNLEKWIREMTQGTDIEESFDETDLPVLKEKEEEWKEEKEEKEEKGEKEEREEKRKKRERKEKRKEEDKEEREKVREKKSKKGKTQGSRIRRERDKEKEENDGDKDSEKEKITKERKKDRKGGSRIKKESFEQQNGNEEEEIDRKKKKSKKPKKERSKREK